MIYSVDALRKDTVALITQIEKQVDEVTKAAFARNCEPAELTDEHGNFSLTPLLLAKATAYNTLVMLQSGENRTGPRPGRQRG